MTKVFGPVVDNQTRCIHYHGKNDIVAIKFKCCNKFYPCYKCHQESEDHDIETWTREEREENAILCGACESVMAINQYMRSDGCNHCKSMFNEGCKNHYHLYFET